MISLISLQRKLETRSFQLLKSSARKLLNLQRSMKIQSSQLLLTNLGAIKDASISASQTQAASSNKPLALLIATVPMLMPFSISDKALTTTLSLSSTLRVTSKLGISSRWTRKTCENELENSYFIKRIVFIKIILIHIKKLLNLLVLILTIWLRWLNEYYFYIFTNHNN